MANVRLALLNGSNITGGTSRILIGGDNYHYSMIEGGHTDLGYTYLAFGTSTSAGAPTEKMRIDRQGNVGIGTASPGATLDVSGTARITTSITTGALRAGSGSAYNISFGYLNASGNVGTASGTTQYSVYAEGRIAATEFNAYSDIRIKKNIIDVNDETALITLRQIEPKRYNYIDTVTKNSTPVWGFIAQQVGSVLDYSVNKITDYVPNIYSKADVVQNTAGSILTLQMGNTNVLDSTKSSDGKIKIKIYTNNEELPVIETNVKTIINDTQLQIEETINELVSEVFVYGQIVNDFNALNKDAIFTVSVAALQEVDRQLQTAKNDISDLKTRILQLEAAILNN
jgi:hypothetical protein